MMKCSNKGRKHEAYNNCRDTDRVYQSRRGDCLFRAGDYVAFVVDLKEGMDRNKTRKAVQ